ncbi:MAG: aspartate-semialdehyde dehydrogenase [Candidatus Peregrinibacteria bacterium]|nr:aspartate-semialdehyde dehydrogenase [Candidatus Peregrinibacteria bacterium]
MHPKSIAIVGTGVVGQEIIRCLDELNFMVGDLELFASARSAGNIVDTPFGVCTISEFSLDKLKDFDIVFLCVGGGFSEKFGEALSEQNGVVIDNSSYFRYHDNIPLIVPEVNPEAVKGAKLIANPNCTTAILAVALYPIYKEFGLKRTIISTYQATSGGGEASMKELEIESKHYLAGEEVSNERFAHPIPFNLIPAIDVFQDNGYTKEEMKVTWETRKIFGNEDLKVSCTAVRIPTFRAHAESVTIQTERPVDPAKVREVLQNVPGVKVVDDPENQVYPMPLTATQKFDVEVGRIRRNDVFDDCGLDFFVCGDQILKGAALNAVQIAQLTL